MKMDWEFYRQELFDTGVTVFNLDYNAVENIKKFNINVQEKVDNDVIPLTLEMRLQLRQIGDKGNQTSSIYSNSKVFSEIKDKIVEINKLSSLPIKYIIRDSSGSEIDYNNIKHLLSREPRYKYHKQLMILGWSFSANYNTSRIVREFLIEKYNELIDQLWYYKSMSDIDEDAFLWNKLKDIYLKLYEGKVTEKKVNKVYHGVHNKTNDEGCFIYKHSDGLPIESAQCQMLLYLNDDWKLGMGGELSCINSKGKERIIEPKIGTCVVIDYTKNPSHEVKVVKEKNYLRNVIRCDWIIDTLKKN
jgi:Rps23 Pro-64 3,4-dihydroxylase Tpa1-like proline 4-hydroxylase